MSALIVIIPNLIPPIIFGSIVAVVTIVTVAVVDVPTHVGVIRQSMSVSGLALLPTFLNKF